VESLGQDCIRGARPVNRHNRIVLLADMLVAVPDWYGDALCAEHPDVDFFPERGQSAAPAVAVCSSCLVRDDCLAWALRRKITVGVWGGKSARERRQISRRRRLAEAMS
jgi:WhiB family redox-sensing transcriptional regulator